MKDHETRTRAGTVWAWVPALLLGSMLLGLGVLAYIAIDDPGFALEANYYDKAVHWDRAQVEERASLELGLQLTLLEPLVIGPDGRVEVALTVTDRAGAALGSAQVKLEAFPNAYASRIERALLRETAPGVYRCQLARGVRGLWELRFEVQQGSSRARHILRRDLAKAGAA